MSKKRKTSDKVLQQKATHSKYVKRANMWCTTVNGVQTWTEEKPA